MTAVGRLLLGLCGAALVFAMGVVWGRASTPVKTIEVERKAKETTAATEKAEATAVAKIEVKAATADTGKVVTRWKTKRVVVSGDCVEETSGEREEARNQTSTTASNGERRDVSKKETRLETENETFERAKVVEREKDRWLIGVMGRIGTDRRAGVGPVLGRDFGPIHLQVAADIPGRAATAVVGVRF